MKKSKKKDDSIGARKKEKKASHNSLPHEDPLAEADLFEDNEPSDNSTLRFVEPGDIQPKKQTKKLSKKKYNKELRRLQIELVKLQEWVKQEGLKVVVIFEGRDAAGKGGVIK